MAIQRCAYNKQLRYMGADQWVFDAPPEDAYYVRESDHIAVVKKLVDALTSYVEFVDERNTIEARELVVYSKARALLAEEEGEPCKN